jgi:L,D-transpeptidase catalytic domain/Putative peptidoglycan binding domain
VPAGGAAGSPSRIQGFRLPRVGVAADDSGALAGETPCVNILRSMLAKVALAVLAAAVVVSCGSPGAGSGGHSTRPTTTSPSDLRAQRLAAERRVLARYLGQTAAAAEAVCERARSGPAVFSSLATTPDARWRMEARQARLVAGAYRRYARALSAVPPPAGAHAVARGARTSATIAARVMAAAARALALRDTDAASRALEAARARLARAAELADGLPAVLTARAHRLRYPLPGWVGCISSVTARLLHASQVAPLTLQTGSSGAQVVRLQSRLAQLTYLPRGYATASYDYTTVQAVIAFQGWQGLARDGVAGPITLAALRTAGPPRPWQAGGGTHIEIHLAQQVLLMVADGSVVRTVHVSTGAPGRETPTGSFAVYRKEQMSWSVPFHTWMPLASYFSGGYAMHEYPDVPPYPASHGCVRVPAGDAQAVWDFAAIGTPVTIR